MPKIPDRTDRTLETRESETRAKAWKPPSVLPDPPDIPGYVHRWIRKSTLSVDDETNFARRRAEGWEPVTTEEYQGKMVLPYIESKSGNIESGGLILARCSTEVMAERDKYYRDLTRRQMDGVNAAREYVQGADSRMGKFVEDQRTQVVRGSRDGAFGNGE